MKVEKIFVKTQYNHDRDAESDASGLRCLDESKTQQQFLEESDINFIANRYGLTGELPLPRSFDAIQGDFEEFDLQTAMNQVRAAEEAFMAYPADIRAKFDNDPNKFVEFFQDPDNTEKAVKLGLAVARPQQPNGATDEPGTQKSTSSGAQDQARDNRATGPQGKTPPAEKP